MTKAHVVFSQVSLKERKTKQNAQLYYGIKSTGQCSISRRASAPLVEGPRVVCDPLDMIRV
jgi:hypothetical protein